MAEFEVVALVEGHEGEEELFELGLQSLQVAGRVVDVLVAAAEADAGAPDDPEDGRYDRDRRGARMWAP